MPRGNIVAIICMIYYVIIMLLLTSLCTRIFVYIHTFNFRLLFGHFLTLTLPIDSIARLLLQTIGPGMHARRCSTP